MRHAFYFYEESWIRFEWVLIHTVMAIGWSYQCAIVLIKSSTNSATSNVRKALLPGLELNQEAVFGVRLVRLNYLNFAQATRTAHCFKSTVSAP